MSTSPVKIGISANDSLAEGEKTPKQVESYAPTEIYLLKYKDRSNIVEKHFGMKSTGDPKEDVAAAIKRGMLFCDRMRYRFIHCEPFLISLAALEERFAEM